jgi:hypothetical protein
MVVEVGYRAADALKFLSNLVALNPTYGNLGQASQSLGQAAKNEVIHNLRLEKESILVIILFNHRDHGVFLML